ncbi:glycoside hydrolase family 3 N-terminal domain-containing protein [Iamia majanohamensis]|uniref:beta-N-acetylhexosaminidase n=1 Tax=Iamia majanohamensis TaxID=467976 RepID=A0AAE9Y9B4_9ACTN|nr:glycoside hydrolase family 3 N-terminal domain-containing protein [Iamia majanohamensis]WCO68997.1 glycoside hydrolase family 3 N-terminal domain-containing protein [Iamia majanohamensis]
MTAPAPDPGVRRTRLLLVALGLVVVVVATVAVLADDGGGGEEATGSTPSPTPSTAERTPTTPPPTAPPSAPSTTAAAPAPAACDATAAVAAWPLRRRLAALVMVGVDPSGTGEATAVVEDHHVGGVFVGGDDTTLLTSGALATLRDGSPTGLFVAVDEEGGRVQRIEGIDGDVPSAREQAATTSPDEVRALAQRRAQVMADLGVTMDLAPVVDVSDQDDDTVIGDRSWSDDPAAVVTYAGAYADGLLAEGVAPVLKHFPGHGQASGDSHEGAVTTPPLADLRSRDLVPYEQLLPRLGGSAAVMLGHLDVPGLTEDGTPSSLSPATVALLRQDYGFDGVVMTDDLAGMEAVTARLGTEEAAVAALAAGVDVVLLAGTDVGSLLDRLEQAVAAGGLDEAAVDASVVRTLRLKGLDPCGVAL